MKKIIIAIDGPAGSGKTSTAKIVAEKLGYIYIDTGAMYRAVTLAWLRTKQPLNNEVLTELLKNIKIELEASPKGQITKLNGNDVSDEIRSVEVNKYVSPISAVEIVRTAMVDLQRKLAINKGCVMDGRDIGTTVFPNAELKIYLTASIGARAKRRLNEYMEKGIKDLSFDEIATQILERDKFDSTREISPLTKAKDAIEIDTSDLTLESQAEMVEKLALKIINNIN